MNKTEIAEILAKPYSQQLLSGRIPARFSYIGVDGDPRVIPIGFSWKNERLLMFTVPKSAKVAALKRNPRVAITIDTESFPPKALLLRGTVELTLEEGCPDDYKNGASGLVPADAFDEWAAGVDALYDEMYRIAFIPDWVKLLDFETTIPKSVQDIIEEKQKAQG
jgi:hypothetical protein